MRLSKQLFAPGMKKPTDFEERKTLSLLEDGVFTFFRDPGIPFYLPIGRNVLSNLKNIFLDEAEKLGMSQIEIPAVMRDEVLEEGEEIVETFNEKIIRLNNENFAGYHLLTTPEPMMLDLSTTSLSSHNQLPVRFVYNVDVFRAIKKPKGLLRGRQFKVFMGNSLDEDRMSLKQSLELFGQLSRNIFNSLRIETHERRGFDGIDIEYFYLGEEGDNLAMPEIDSRERIKALSLSMVYQYNPNRRTRARFRDQQNKNARALYSTFGLGTQRTFYALFDANRDDRGFNLPPGLAPFKFSIIPASSEDLEEAERAYREIGKKAMLDDRKNVTFGRRAGFSDYIGIPWKVICRNGAYTVKSRDEKSEQGFSSIEKLQNFLHRSD